MQSTRHAIGIALATLAIWLTPAAAQAPPGREAVVAAAHAIMGAARYCAVITTDADGRPQARTIDPLPPDGRSVVWFATNPKSRKVAQLRRDPRVTLYYFDSRDPQLGYVTLLGRARLVSDPVERRQHWKQEWDAFWPDPGSSVLVEVTPDRLEVSSPKQGIQNDPVTWAPRTVEFPRGSGRGR